MAYNDVQLRAFSQIAYWDLEADYEKHSGENNEAVSLSVLLEPWQKEKLCALGVTEQEIDDWKISAVHNTNDSNGFYACVIETSTEDATVAFRGSENIGEMENVIHDWVGADLGLVNSTCTNQQAEVDRFLGDEDINRILSKYNNLTMTGHSLGGNLAEYATIISSKYGLNENIQQCVSLDGPGHSKEFITLYSKEIQMMKSKMEKYRASFVGGLLNDLPGVEPQDVKVSKDGMIERHFMENWEVTGKSFSSADPDVLTSIISHISEGIDHMPRIVGDVLVTVVSGIWIGAMWTADKMFDGGNLTPAGYAIIVGAVIAVPIIGIPAIVTTLLTTVVAVLAFVVAVMVYELVYDLVVTVVNAICDAVQRIYQWGKEVVDQLRNSVIALVEGVRGWYNRNFNAGYKYATANPWVTLDTYKLRSYAQRLSNVNSRIVKLDLRLDGLYWQVGLLGLWNLIQADALTGYNWSITRCAAYLMETAGDFDSVESNLASSL